MALSQAQMQKYGLSASNATASDHEKGIVSDGKGNYYSIDGFKREQKEDIDTDQGKVFSSGLYEDSGISRTNFNTATDVEGALMELDGEKSFVPEEVTTKDPSERLATARERVKQYEDDKWSGRDAEKLYTPIKDTKGFLDKYKTNFKKNLETANKKRFGATE